MFCGLDIYNGIRDFMSIKVVGKDQYVRLFFNFYIMLQYMSMFIRDRKGGERGGGRKGQRGYKINSIKQVI